MRNKIINLVLLGIFMVVGLSLISCQNENKNPVEVEKEEKETNIKLGAMVNIYEDRDVYMNNEEWLYTFTDKSDQSCVLSKDKIYIMTVGYITTWNVKCIIIEDNDFVYDHKQLEIKSIYDMVLEEHGPVYSTGYKIRNISGADEATLGVYLEPYLVKIKFKFV